MSLFIHWISLLPLLAHTHSALRYGVFGSYFVVSTLLVLSRSLNFWLEFIAFFIHIPATYAHNHNHTCSSPARIRWTKNVSKSFRSHRFSFLVSEWRIKNATGSRRRCRCRVSVERRTFENGEEPKMSMTSHRLHRTMYWIRAPFLGIVYKRVLLFHMNNSGQTGMGEEHDYGFFFHVDETFGWYGVCGCVLHKHKQKSLGQPMWASVRCHMWSYK